MIDLSEKDLNEIYSSGKTLCDYFNNKIENNDIKTNKDKNITNVLSIISEFKLKFIKLSKLLKYYYDEPNRINKIKKLNDEYKILDLELPTLKNDIINILTTNNYTEYTRIFIKHQIEIIKVRKLLEKLKSKIVYDKVYNNDTSYVSVLNILETHTNKVLNYINITIYNINLITKYIKDLKMPKNK